MKNYVKQGKTLTLTAPYDVLSGAGFRVGRIFAVAAYDAVSGATVEGDVEGVFDLAKDTSVFAMGDPVYWDNTNKAITSTAAGNLQVGRAEAAALTGGATVRVKLNGYTMMPIFISAEQTGTGSAQNVAHGLGAIPSQVFIAPTDLTPATVGSYSAVEGTHTTTNVVVTVTANKKFKVLAIL